MRGASFLGSFTSGRRSRGRLSDLLEVTINKIRNGEKTGTKTHLIVGLVSN